jgi:hypothetical protein
MARLYDELLVVEQVEHSTAAFVKFSHTSINGEVCPAGGELIYVDGVVECSVHEDHDSEDEEDEGKDDGGVSFL